MFKTVSVCSTSGSVLVNCKFALSNIKRPNSSNKYILWRENIDIQCGWLALSKSIVSVVCEKTHTRMHTHVHGYTDTDSFKCICTKWKQWLVVFLNWWLYYITEGSTAHKSTPEKWKFTEKNEPFIDEYNSHSLIYNCRIVKNMVF